MPIFSRFFVLATALLVTMSLVPRLASATESEKAESTSQEVERLMSIGVRAHVAGDMETALEAFDGAFRLRKHYAIAASLGEMRMRLGQYREAVRDWAFVLENLPESRSRERDQAFEKFRECEARLASLRLSVHPRGAIVHVDGEDLGEAPVAEPIWLEPGVHEIRVEHAGYQRILMSRELQAGTAQQLELTLVAERPLPDPVAGLGRSNVAVDPSGEEKPASPDARTVVLLSGSALTAVAGTLSTIFWVQHGSARASADALQKSVREARPDARPTGACYEPPAALIADCGALLSKRKEQVAAYDRSLAALVTSSVLGVSTVAAFIFWPKPKSKLALRPGLVTSASGDGALFLLGGTL